MRSAKSHREPAPHKPTANDVDPEGIMAARLHYIDSAREIAEQAALAMGVDPNKPDDVIAPVVNAMTAEPRTDMGRSPVPRVQINTVRPDYSSPDIGGQGRTA